MIINSQIKFEALKEFWKQRYPNSYLLFIKSNDSKLNFQTLTKFFESQNIFLSCNSTNALNANYKGTYSIKITIKNSTIVEKLGRTDKTISYYGIATLDNAIRKGLQKSFEILECILTDKQMHQSKRKRRKEL